MPGTLISLEGPNFSGRSAALRDLASVDAPSRTADGPSSRRLIYVPPEVHNALSGLASTVDAELRLHARAGIAGPAMWNIAEELGLLALDRRNPFDLSGGQQALLAVVSASAIADEGIALDCCLEQVDRPLRHRLLQSLLQRFPLIYLADNRANEFVGAQILTRCPPPPIQDSATFGPISSVAPLNALVSSEQDLVLDNISFQYARDIPVLRDVSARLSPGRIYVLEGTNGSGKSTLAKVLCGALRPNTGRVSIGHTLVRPWREPGRIVGYHFQNPDTQLFAPSVEAELALSTRRRDEPPESAERSVRAWANAFGLGKVLQEHPLDLPYVARKRVALAASFAMGRSWLILDEPTLGQDDPTMTGLAELARAYTKAGGGVIIITHSTAFRDLLGGSTLRLAEGSLAIV